MRMNNYVHKKSINSTRCNSNGCDELVNEYDLTIHQNGNHENGRRSVEEEHR